MVLSVTDAQLEVTYPDDRDPYLFATTPGVGATEGNDFTTEGQEPVSITKRIQQWNDSASFTFHYADDRHADAITSGARLDFTAGYHIPGGAETDSFEWTGWAFSPTFKELGAHRMEMGFDAEDYVFELLENRLAYTEFRDQPIAGDDGIVEELLDRFAPEISTDQVDPVDIETDKETDGINVKEVIHELARNGRAVMASEGDALVFRPLVNLDPQFALERGRDFELLNSVDFDDDDLYNEIRIDGATDIDEDEVTAEDATDIVTYRRVTRDDPLFYELDPEKNRLDRISVWTRPESDDDLRVRIQQPNSDGTGPRNARNEEIDIVSDTTSFEFIADEGFRDRFRLDAGEHLGDAPWLIIDSTGDDGHDIGLAAMDVPAIKTYYSYPIFAQDADFESIERYRRRQMREKKDSINTFDAADDYLRGLLREHADPTATVEFEAESLRAHRLTPGELVTIDEPHVRLADEDLLVTERTDTYTGHQLRTTLSCSAVREVF